MASIIRYWVETDKESRDVVGDYEEREYADAKQHAQNINGIVVCAEYEFSDSYMVDDFTADNDIDEER